MHFHVNFICDLISLLNKCIPKCLMLFLISPKLFLVPPSIPYPTRILNQYHYLTIKWQIHHLSTEAGGGQNLSGLCFFWVNWVIHKQVCIFEFNLHKQYILILFLWIVSLPPLIVSLSLLGNCVDWNSKMLNKLNASPCVCVWEEKWGGGRESDPSYW